MLRHLSLLGCSRYGVLRGKSGSRLLKLSRGEFSNLFGLVIKINCGLLESLVLHCAWIFHREWNIPLSPFTVALKLQWMLGEWPCGWAAFFFFLIYSFYTFRQIFPWGETKVNWNFLCCVPERISSLRRKSHWWVKRVTGSI